jgi:hypothetical protein
MTLCAMFLARCLVPLSRALLRVFGRALRRSSRLLRLRRPAGLGPYPQNARDGPWELGPSLWTCPE